MNNTHKAKLLSTLLITVVAISAGCQSGKFPSAPNLAFWKKDNLNLSRNSSDSIPPPSRQFDPEPSHFATADAATPRSGIATDLASRSFEKVSESANTPIREPYKVESTSSSKSNDNVAFGFPKGSDSLVGKAGSQFSMPDANDFRSAMKNTNEQANQFAGAAKSATVDPLKNVAQNANQFGQQASNSSSQFVADTQKFLATNRTQGSIQDAAKKLASAQNPVAADAKSGGWKNDFDLPKPELDRLQGNNALVGGDFGASVERATADAKQSMTDFNQKAIDRFNSEFKNPAVAAVPKASAAVASSPTNQALTKEAGQFEQNWDDSIRQAQKATDSMSQFKTQTQQVASAATTGDFRSSNQFAPQSLNSLSANPPGEQPNLSQFAKPATETPKPFTPSSSNGQFNPQSVESQIAEANPAPSAATVGSFTSTDAPAFQPKQSSSNMMTQRSSSTPNLPSVSSNELARKAQELQQQIEGTTEKAIDSMTQASRDVIGQVSPVATSTGTSPSTNATVGYSQTQQPGGTQRTYPSTNFASFNSLNRERVSTVTPLSQQELPVLKARAGNSDAAVSTAGLPSGLLNGNSSYAPGSVKALAPVRSK